MKETILAWGPMFVLSVFSVSVVFLLAYEFFALWTKIPGATISEMVWSATKRHPWITALICLATGLLYGHFFWQRSHG